MNKNYIKAHLPKDISLVSCLQLTERLVNHPSIENIQVFYGGFITTSSKNQGSSSLFLATLRKKYQEIGRMLDSFEKGESDE